MDARSEEYSNDEDGGSMSSRNQQHRVVAATQERANDEGLKRCPLEPNSKMMAVEARHQERATDVGLKPTPVETDITTLQCL